MIYTDRLILRPPEKGDAIALNDAMNEVWDDLQMWMSWAADGQNTLKATQDYITLTQQQAREGSLPLLGFCKQTAAFVVATGLLLQEGTKDEYSTGYWVSRDFLGKGYATEATNATIRYGFEVFKASKMHIEYYDGNDKSCNVIEKLGFDFTQTQVNAHRRFYDGVIGDVHCYTMTDPAVLPPLDVHWGK